MKNVLAFLLLSIILFACKVAKTALQNPNGPYFGNGVHNGWVDQHSITIWTRLTQQREMNWKGQPFIPLTKKESSALAKRTDVDYLHQQQIPAGLILADMEGACLGANGEVQLTYYPSGKKNTKIQLDWAKVEEAKNFTRQWKLTNLIPDTKYEMELISRISDGQPNSDTINGSFVTPPISTQQKDIAFSITSCHDYIRKDHPDGHKIYAAMEKDNLDFFVHTGDIEYYDKPNPWAMTEPLMYFKWDRLFALPLQRDFYAHKSSYFMKDDHDVLKDDAYPGMFYGPVSFERGLEIFDQEQFPSNDKRYKTVRWGKSLQIWILEGRNFRSKNTDEDGPNKTILGKAQKEWLFKTIKASDADFKIIISSSPILGPDRPKGKNDNYSNTAYAYEGTAIRNFINQFNNVFVCNGDRHWQYATHFEGTNLWEFGSGAGADAHAGGWKPENIKPEHRFLRVKGGYLVVKVYHEKNNPLLRFEHRDVEGKVVHQEEFRTIAN